MKNERILIADDSKPTLEFISQAIDQHGKVDGHKVIGKASSLREVKRIMKKGLKPTTAIVDNTFVKWGDGEEVSKLIRKLSPKTTIVSFSAASRVRWGKENWTKPMAPQDFVAALTNLKH